MIEPVETGRVVAVHVANDSAVKAGDTLIELDPSAAEADAKEARADLAAAEAEGVRRREALAAARAGRYAPSRVVAWPEEVDQSLRAREERVLAADLGQLAATVASFDAQKTQKIAERDMLTKTIATQKNLVATLQERVDMRTKLVESQSGAKSAVIDATETLQYQQTQLAMQQAQLASASTGLDVITRDSEKAVQSFLSDQAQKLETAERQAEEHRQRLAKAEALVDNLTLKAPIDGRVQSSIVTNVGQVLTSGQEVMRIVPQDSQLEIEAYVLNRDIGFVHVGQDAVVKVEVLPLYPIWVGHGPCRAHRQGRDSVAGRKRHGGRPRPRLERVRLRRRRADAEPGVRGRARAAGVHDPGRRRRTPADLGHGGDGRNQDRLAPPDGISLLASRRSRLERDAGALTRLWPDRIARARIERFQTLVRAAGRPSLAAAAGSKRPASVPSPPAPLPPGEGLRASCLRASQRPVDRLGASVRLVERQKM